MSSVSWYFFMSFHLFFCQNLLCLPETFSLSDFAPVDVIVFSPKPVKSSVFEESSKPVFMLSISNSDC